MFPSGGWGPVPETKSLPVWYWTPASAGEHKKRFFRCDKSAPMPVRLVRQHYFGAGRIEYIGSAGARLYAWISIF